MATYTKSIIWRHVLQALFVYLGTSIVEFSVARY